MPASRGRSLTNRPTSNSGRSPSKPKSSKKAAKTPRSIYDVFFYVPQIVGYFRIVCTIWSLYLATKFKAGGDYYVQSIVLYMLSFIGDLFDGMAARKFDQSSKFGGVLDMVTDRCTTAGMLPACVMKNIVNVAQLMSASKDIARKDAAEWNKNNKV
ncbi:hypothetical protein TrCOL_g3445 [Triparma columacea]|uniref:CDP-diacylglycerol--inositol 3-phosphatidyltransferase n=1 Tax=Triparma columacea TaxID=722753 RepID=A0A9W7LC21_9STRA|nr:hypothetical protein TrCOL_g3445 [Triparma columacea]